MYRLEFGPADGEDVTSNLMLEVPGRKEVCTGPLPLPYSSPSTLPFLYCGPCLLDLDSPQVKQAIGFIESGSYHALFRNCILAVDLLVRVLSGGRVINGPQLYDLIAGEVPKTDNPLINVFQILIQRSWTDICDASALAREMLIQGQEALKEDPRPNKRPFSSLAADGEATEVQTEVQTNRENTALL